MGFVCWDMGVGVISCDGRLDFFERRVVDVVVADFQNRRGVTTAHARGAQDADLFWVQTVLKGRFQCLCTSKFA